MSGILSEEEIVRGLVAQGVPRGVAEREAKRQVGEPWPYRPRQTLVALSDEMMAGAAAAREEARQKSHPAPVSLRIPWSALVSDNVKLRAARRGDSATVVLTPEYREAKKRIAALCVDVMAGRPPADCPLSLVARVWVPNNQRRDVVNFSKALHDAMAGTVFEDDSQLHDVRWIRAGVDVDAPRAEITISPLTPQDTRP